MHESQAARLRARSPFSAAFLSLIFPGLGQLYAGAPTRALAFAAAPILFVALVAGVVLRMDRIDLIGLVLNPFVLSSVFVVNLIVLVYRLVAIIDAYRVAEYMDAYAASGDGRAGTARIRRNWARAPFPSAGPARSCPASARPIPSILAPTTARACGSTACNL